METHVSGVSDGVSVGSDKPGVIRVHVPWNARITFESFQYFHFQQSTFDTQHVKLQSSNKVCQFKNETVEYYWWQGN